jgi:hypothetical protein
MALRDWLNFRRVRFWLITAVLVYTLAGFFAVPWLLEHFAVKEVQELGRSLKVGRVRVNPFVLDIRVEDAELRDTDGSLLVAYEDYYWNVQLSSLINRAWTFREIRLIGLKLNAERFSLDDNNLGRFADSFPEKGSPDGDPAGQGLPRVIIHDLRVVDGRLGITDHVYERDFETELGPITIQVRNLSTLPDSSGRQQVTVVTEDGGSIAWDGELQLSPLSSSGQVTVRGRSLTEVHRYLDLLVPFTSSGGEFEADFDYSFARSADGELELSVDELDARLFDLALEGPRNPGELIRIPRIGVSGGSMRWPQRHVAVEAIEVSGADIKVRRDAHGRINLLDLLPSRGGEGEPTLAVSAEEQAWQLELGALKAEDATIRLQDRGASPPVDLELRKLSLEASGISNQADVSIPTGLSFDLGSGGSVRFDGEVQVLPAASGQGSISVRDLGLAIAQPYLERFARVTIEDGALALDGMIESDHQDPASYSGSVHVQSLDLRDTNKGEQLLGWDLLDIDRLEFSLASRELEISEIELDGPFGRVHIAQDLSTNIGDLVVKRPETHRPDQNAGPMAVTVGGVEVKDAALEFSDFSLPLPFAASIRSLEGEVSTLSTTSVEPARISLEGRVNEFGLARISGTVNAWAFADHTDIEITFRNLEMARLTPYTVQFAGHAIDAGRMDLDLDYSIAASQLQGGNDIVIRELVLGEKVDHPDAASLPLGLAVALLKDSEGVIDIELPVSGDLNDPEFSYGGIIAKAIFNLITKAVTAPFRLLGNLVGMESEDFGTLVFEAGRSDLSPPDLEKLVKLAEAMRQRPGLKLEVAGVYDNTFDPQALQESKLEELLEAREEAAEAAGAVMSAEIARRAAEALFTETFPDVPLESVQSKFIGAGEGDEPVEAVLDVPAYVAEMRLKLMERQAVSEQELLALAEARADAALEALAAAESGTSLPVQRAGVIMVEADGNRSIPLELKVTIEEN